MGQRQHLRRVQGFIIVGAQAAQYHTNSLENTRQWTWCTNQRTVWWCHPRQGNIGSGVCACPRAAWFWEKICSRFANWNNNAFGTTKFRLWEHCLQGKALTKWEIVKANYPTDADKMSAYFTEAIQFYLERVAGVKYLGNFIIRILSTNKKPALVSIENYHDWRNELKRHLDGP